MLIVVFAGLYLIPPFAEMFEEFQIDIPTPSKILVWWSEWGVWIFLASIPAISLVLLAIRFLAGPAIWYRFVASWPLVGPIWHWSSVAEMARFMSILLDQRMALPDALQLVSLGVRDANVSQACSELSEQVAAGQSLSQTITVSRRLPSELVPLLRSGEKTETLSEAFRGSAEYFEQCAVIRADVLREVLPPLLFIFVGVCILFLFVGLFGPLINMINSLT